MSTVVASLFTALLSWAIRHVRVLHGLNLATMAGLLASEIALIQQAPVHGPQTTLWGVGFALSKPVRGLMDRVVTILTVR